MGHVYIDTNLKKTSERIDPQGNIINPRTKEILKENKEEVFETPVQQPPQATQAPTGDAMSIQEQIDQAKANLAKLEELKKLKIEEMKAQLELLQQ